MPVLAVIPARYASTRFPGKPLHLIAGRPLVQHVWERCRQCQRVQDVVIATDDERIAQTARAFGAQVAMTRPDHPSGTDRIAEAAGQFPHATSILNVQGDEPLISPALIDSLAAALEEDPTLPMITAASPIERAEDLENPNIVKAVMTARGDALYFSRSRIPFARNEPALPTFRHLGIYGYSREFLFQFVAWAPSPLERTESLEQLRALENGARCRIVITRDISPGVDTPEQAAEAERLILGGAH